MFLPINLLPPANKRETKKGLAMREINIEAGKPLVENALNLLKREMQRAINGDEPALKVIHGYGSSGKGGAIRSAVRNFLARQKELGNIKDYIAGESFTIFNRSVTDAFLAAPELRKDKDLERHNNGVTIVII